LTANWQLDSFDGKVRTLPYRGNAQKFCESDIGVGQAHDYKPYGNSVTVSSPFVIEGLFKNDFNR
jgi:hypothetical protein